MIFRCNETVNAIIGKIHLKKVREGKRRYSFQQHEHKTDKKSICIFLNKNRDFFLFPLFFLFSFFLFLFSIRLISMTRKKGVGEGAMRNFLSLLVLLDPVSRISDLKDFLKMHYKM